MTEKVKASCKTSCKKVTASKTGKSSAAPGKPATTKTMQRRLQKTAAKKPVAKNVA